MAVDPVTAWGLAKTVTDVTRNLYDAAKSVKDHETKQKIDEVLDVLRDLKQTASELEDENRALRERLRFKSDEYEFKTPFWYERRKPDQPLCAKCFAKNTAAPMGEPYTGAGGRFRRCLVCDSSVQVGPRHDVDGPRSQPGVNDWMGEY